MSSNPPIIGPGSTRAAMRMAIRDLQRRVGVDEPVWDDLTVPLITAKAPAVAGPTWTQFRDDGAGSIGVWGWAFAKAAVNTLYFAKQVLHGWAIGTQLEPHVHFSPNDGGAGNIVWELEYTIADIGGLFPLTTLLQVTTDAGGDSATPAQYLHTLKGWNPDIDVPVEEATVSAMILGRISRLGNDAADTYDDVVFGHEVDFHYARDGLGSRTSSDKSLFFPD